MIIKVVNVIHFTQKISIAPIRQIQEVPPAKKVPQDRYIQKYLRKIQ